MRLMGTRKEKIQPCPSSAGEVAIGQQTTRLVLAIALDQYLLLAKQP